MSKHFGPDEAMSGLGGPETTKSVNVSHDRFTLQQRTLTSAKQWRAADVEITWHLGAAKLSSHALQA
jgi:hypothetical protein